MYHNIFLALLYIIFYNLNKFLHLKKKKLRLNISL